MNILSNLLSFILRSARSVKGRLRRDINLLLERIQSLPFYRHYIRCVVSDIKITSYSGLSKRALRHLRKQHKDLDQFKDNENKTFLFVIVKGWHAGSACLARYKDRPEFGTGMWLMGCNIRPAFRGLGAGERLVAKTIEHAREMDAGELTLFVYKNNFRAISLYRKLGFEEVKTPGFGENILKSGKDNFIFLRIVPAH
jgi:GNAT superfamily N-acetyltransferase